MNFNRKELITGLDAVLKVSNAPNFSNYSTSNTAMFRFVDNRLELFAASSYCAALWIYESRGEYKDTIFVAEIDKLIKLLKFSTKEEAILNWTDTHLNAKVEGGAKYRLLDTIDLFSFSVFERLLKLDPKTEFKALGNNFTSAFKKARKYCAKQEYAKGIIGLAIRDGYICSANGAIGVCIALDDAEHFTFSKVISPAIADILPSSKEDCYISQEESRITLLYLLPTSKLLIEFAPLVYDRPAILDTLYFDNLPLYNASIEFNKEKLLFLIRRFLSFQEAKTISNISLDFTKPNSVLISSDSKYSTNITNEYSEVLECKTTGFIDTNFKLYLDLPNLNEVVSNINSPAVVFNLTKELSRSTPPLITDGNKLKYILSSRTERISNGI